VALNEAGKVDRFIISGTKTSPFPWKNKKKCVENTFISKKSSIFAA